jgi:hypothetical protein
VRRVQVKHSFEAYKNLQQELVRVHIQNSIASESLFSLGLINFVPQL